MNKNNYSKIPTYEECLKSVKDCKAFSHSVQEIHGKKVESFKYNINIPGMWDIDYHINMRGIVFIDKKLVAIPFPKFFNVGENKSTQNLDLSDPEHIHQKIDGSLISFFKIGEITELKTMRSVFSDVANDCRIYTKNRYDILKYVDELLKLDYSPVFEYVSTKSRIVIDYGKPDLYYLGSRHLITGEMIFPYEDIELNVIRPDSIKIPLRYTISQIEEVMKKDEEEGVVMVLRDGTMVKMKTKTYCDLHRIVTDITLKNIIKNIINNTVDDAKGLLYQYDLFDDIKRIELVEKYYHKKYDKYLKEANDYLEENSGKDRKTIALELFSGKNKLLGKLVMLMIDDRSCDDVINREILIGIKEKSFSDVL